MKICRTIFEIRDTVAKLRANGDVGLVTTMGALHAGHRALVDRAVAENAGTIATIFVNPTQFGDPKDLETYPRNEAADLALLQDAGVEAVFIPSAEEIYPEGEETIVETTRLANMMHGAVRPGHFRGVATVVCKLFNIIGADRAYFGEKDYQQLAVIRRMVRDLHMPIAIVGVPTVREADGLALSSRNVRLIGGEREDARVLHQALITAEALIKDGKTIEDAAAAIRSVIATKASGRLTGLDIVDATSFEPAKGVPARTIGIMISVQFQNVLLIDQKEITP